MSSVPYRCDIFQRTRQAASLLVLRDGPEGPELLLMRRPERDNDFRSGICTFPGGVLDASDRSAHGLCLGLDDAQASARLGLASGGLDYFVCALRECFEEVGLLYVCDTEGQPVDLQPHAADLAVWRGRLHRGEATLAQLCQAHGWRLDLREVAYLSHWLTPLARPKRFDTRFLVMRAPAGQQAQADLGEALELLWLTPQQALAPERELKLLNVTQVTLRSMSGFASAQQAYAHARALRSAPMILPWLAQGARGAQAVLPGEPAYEELTWADPEGHGQAGCELPGGQAQRLAPRLWRVNAAGVEGWHSWFVDPSGQGRWLLLDPPLQAGAAWDAVRAASPGTVAAVLHRGPPAAGGAPWLRAWPPCAATAVQTLSEGAGLADALAGLQRVGQGLWWPEQALFFSLGGGDGAVPTAAHWLAPDQGFMRWCARG